MLDQRELRQAWNRAHKEKPASQRPEDDLVALIEQLRGQLPPGAPVLDAGCGRGRNARYLSETGFRVYGCDLSPVAIKVARKQARQQNLPIDFQVAALTRLPYLDGTFAAAVCAHVLPYHLRTDIATSTHELWRVLKPGGGLYADFLDCDDAEYGCGPELEQHTFLDPDGVPVHFSSRQEINELLSGFALQRVARLELGSRPRVAWVVWATRAADG
jgi:SAM-dependent methyltransferase